MTAVLHDDLYDQITATVGPTKYCSACGQHHPVSAFAFKSIAHLKLHSQCRIARRAKAADAYAADGARQRAANAARRRATTTAVNDLVDRWLDGARCACCGSTAALCAIGSTGRSLKSLRKDGLALAAIEAELAAATVRCRRCGRSRCHP